MAASKANCQDGFIETSNVTQEQIDLQFAVEPVVAFYLVVTGELNW